MLLLIILIILLSFKYGNKDFEMDIREDRYIVKPWMLLYTIYMCIPKEYVYDYILIIGMIINMCVDKLWHKIHYKEIK